MDNNTFLINLELLFIMVDSMCRSGVLGRLASSLFLNFLHIHGNGLLNKVVYSIGTHCKSTHATADAHALLDCNIDLQPPRAPHTAVKCHDRLAKNTTTRPCGVVCFYLAPQTDTQKHSTRALTCARISSRTHIDITRSRVGCNMQITPTQTSKPHSRCPQSNIKCAMQPAV